jgi:hypothetical protein
MAAISGTYLANFNSFYDGATTCGLGDYGAVSAYTYTFSTNFFSLIEGPGKSQTAIVKSLDTDGATLTWTRAGATAPGTATLYIICLR